MPGMILAERVVTLQFWVAATQRGSLTLAPSAAFATATAGPLSFRTRFIYIDCPSPHLAAVQTSNRFVPFFRICHFYETESTRAASFAISKNADPVECPIRFENFAQLFFRSIKAKVPNENIFHRAPLSVIANRVNTQYLVGIF